MKKTISLLVLLLTITLASAQKLDNTFYAFNNAVRLLPNAPKGVENQAALIKKLGYDGLEGHHSDNYTERRASLDAAGLKMPEIYLPVEIHEDGKVTYFNGIKEIIKDSEGKGLVVALAAHSKPFMNNKKEGDKILVKAIQELADYAAPFGVKIAVYPHANFYCERLDHSIKLAKKAKRPNVGAIFNTCHLFKVEGMEGWERKLKKAIPYLYMISINGLDGGNTQNYTWKELIKPLGEGNFDTYQIVKIAKDNGYEGSFGLQCYNIKDDCEVALTKSMNTWKKYQERYSNNQK